MKIELHKDKTRIISLSKGIDFVGFRSFYYFKSLRKRNIKNMEGKVKKFLLGKIERDKMVEVFQGWNAYAKWADSLNLRSRIYLDIVQNL